jgi:hypothetical protein
MAGPSYHLTAHTGPNRWKPCHTHCNPRQEEDVRDTEGSLERHVLRRVRGYYAIDDRPALGVVQQKLVPSSFARYYRRSAAGCARSPIPHWEALAGI